MFSVNLLLQSSFQIVMRHPGSYMQKSTMGGENEDGNIYRSLCGNSQSVKKMKLCDSLLCTSSVNHKAHSLYSTINGNNMNQNL